MEFNYTYIQLEENFVKALEREEFQLYYQPKVDLNTGKIRGVEALIRWQHPEKGLITPSEFVPLAVETGLIIPITEWVLRTACEQGKKWQEKGLDHLIISVNVSAQQFQSNLVEVVQKILKETGFSPNYLELEITESIMLDTLQVSHVLTDLKRIGVQISLDDFGIGYSSLYYLNELPVDKINIDKSFVSKFMEDTKGATIIKAIISMSHQLKIEVIAKGIETKEDLVFLQQNLCMYGQGFFFSKPLRPDEFVQKFSEIEQIVRQVDITERKKSEEKYRRLVEFSPEPIIVYHHGFIEYANPACIQLLGASSLKELMGKSIMEFFDQESVKLIEKRIQDLNQIGISVPPTEEKIIRVDGTFVDVEVSGITIEHDDKPSFLMMYHDITRRKRAEEALRKSESEYRLIAENTHDYIRVLDVNGVIQYASPSHESILGFSPNVYKGQLFFELMHPDDIPNTQEQFTQIISSKTPRQVEFRYKHANGGWVYVESCGSPVLNEHGGVTSVVIVGRDISERKKTEELIIKSEKLSVVGQLAAGVAHEIRNPLTSIKGFIQLLQNELDKRFYTDVILSEINRIESIVREFLTLAKPQAPQMKEVVVTILLEQVVILFDSQALLKNVQFIQEIDSKLPPIRCNENQIKQVFMNILQNAVEAMPNGGIIRTVIVRENSDFIKFRFIDQGCGISEERIKKIGEPFFSTKEKGTGLGLMISQKIVQEHGGTLLIESTVNQGTTVDVILPIK